MSEGEYPFSFTCSESGRGSRRKRRQGTAKQISAAFESAIERGDIRLDQLMDERYREIPGTDP